MAIAAILPKNERSEDALVCTVVGVTILSTVAMIAYPILTEQIGMSEDVAGVFLGTTIHDVAQVVGAGFSISDRTGEVATIVKLIRVSLLAPVIIIATLVVRRVASDGEFSDDRPQLIPPFVLAFFVLVALNSLGFLPIWMQQLATQASSWALLAAISAVGMRTSLKEVFDVGGRAIALLVTQTILIALMALGMLQWV